MKYQIGGSLASDAPSYIKRQADDELFDALIAGEFCYVFNSRQMGKSSLLVQTKGRLQQQGFRCAAIDMTRIGSETIMAQQWYKGVVAELWRGFSLFGSFNLKEWWRDEADLSIAQRLGNFIEDVLFNQFPSDRLFIFVDEIDSTLRLNFPIDDFFAFIRFCYNQRAVNPAFDRVTFALFGVATPSDLIRDRTRTPFNIGRAIDLRGFQFEEAQPLALGLEKVTPQPQKALQAILDWTNGQPFLTQKLCQLFVQSAVNEQTDITTSIDQLVQTQIIHNWQAQDEPEHLKTIRDRLLRNEQRAGRLLAIYQQLLQASAPVPTDDSREQIELLLSGLVVKQQGYLTVKNRIYQTVFDPDWVANQLALLRPYGQAIDAWVISGQTDDSRLLRGQALLDAQAWTQGKSLGEVDYQFLAASQDFAQREVQLRLEAERTQEIEARLAQERKTSRQQRFFLSALSAALVLSTALGGVAFFQYRNAQKQLEDQIYALSQSAEAFLSADRQFDALLVALRSAQPLLDDQLSNQPIRDRVTAVLKQTLFQVREQNRFEGANGRAKKVVYSPDGQMIAAIVEGPRETAVRLWSAQGQPIGILPAHGLWLTDVAISPDGQIIATASSDHTVKLRNRSGKELGVLRGHATGVLNVRFTPDGSNLVTLSDDRTLKIWNLQGQLLRTIPVNSSGVLGMELNQQGTQIAVIGKDSSITLWTLEGNKLQTIANLSKGIAAIAFSPDGQTMAVSGDDNSVRLWSLDGKLQGTLIENSERVQEVAFSPNGSQIATVGTSRIVKIWNLQGKLLKSFNEGLISLSFSPDGKTLATGSEDRAVRIWNLTGETVPTLDGHQAIILSVQFSPDGQAIATASGDKTVKLWNRDGKLLHTLQGHTDVVISATFSPNGQTIASASNDKTVRLWNRRGELLYILRGHQDYVNDVSFSPDGQQLASASRDKTIKFWNLDGKLLRTLQDDKSLWSVAFSPDGRAIAAAGHNNVAKLWDLNGTLLHQFQHGAWVNQVRFSPDGRALATSSFDETVKLWNRSGQAISSFKAHQAKVRRISFSPDSQAIATISDEDGSAKLWSRDGTLLATLDTTTDHYIKPLLDISFSPDGRTIAIAKGSSVILEPFDLEQLNAIACQWLTNYLRYNPNIQENDPIRLRCLK